MNKKQFAFTLIELLVVIAIIGILSGLIVVAMGGMTQKATIAKAQVFSNSLKNSLMLNLVSEWRLDENGGTATADSWSGGNAGTLTGATLPVWKTDCVNGSCLQFDGADDYVDFGNKSNLSMGLGAATISFWVNFDNAVAPQEEMLAITGAGLLSQPGYQIERYNGTSRLYIYFSDGTIKASNYLSASGTLVANTWYNVVIVFTRASVVQACINGVQQTGYSLAISGYTGNVQNYSNLRIGAASATTARTAGKMDEVRVYNAAMTNSQIKEQYYAGVNSLFIKGEITKEEYLSRINNIAKQ